MVGSLTLSAGTGSGTGASLALASIRLRTAGACFIFPSSPREGPPVPAMARRPAPAARVRRSRPSIRSPMSHERGWPPARHSREASASAASASGSPFRAA